MFGWLSNLVGLNGHAAAVANMRRQRDSLGQRFAAIKARYDAARADSQANHWANADNMSADAANSYEVRATLRKRSRYEIANNSYAKGVVLTFANETVGRGPRLQMRFPKEQRELNRLIEKYWHEWDQASAFSERLHVFVQSKVGDGEGQALLGANPKIDFPVKLNITPIEAEQFTSQSLFGLTNQPQVDGIELDEFGNPAKYHILTYHPGDSRIYSKTATRIIDPRWFLHWFRCDRPGQHRGIPEITPCLGLFAQLRRWTLAVLTAAETAANFAAVLQTEGTPDTTAQADPWDEVEVRLGTLMTLPAGWKMGQFEATQPVSAYDQFKHELLKEIARCLNMPFPVVAGDSSLMNYASGRLDFQNWYRTIKVSRASLERVVIDHVFREWLIELTTARTLLGRPLLPTSFDVRNVPHGWFYDAVPHVDPIKDNTGDSLALANNTDTLANICAAQGLDWEEVLMQRSEEVERMRELGLEIYLPDFAMEVQKEIAQENGSGGGGGGSSSNRARAVSVSFGKVDPNGVALADVRRQVQAQAETITELKTLLAASMASKAPEEKQQDVNVNVSVAPSPITATIHVPKQDTPEVTVENTITAEAQPAPVVNVTVDPTPIVVSPPTVNVDVAAPTVNVAAPNVDVNVPPPRPMRKTPVRDKEGNIVYTVEEPIEGT